MTSENVIIFLQCLQCPALSCPRPCPRICCCPCCNSALALLSYPPPTAEADPEKRFGGGGALADWGPYLKGSHTRCKLLSLPLYLTVDSDAERYG